MNLVTRSARRDSRYLNAEGLSLATRKAAAHRAYRSQVRVTLRNIVSGFEDGLDADFNPRREICVTGWEVA